jgi:hypothetical protein
MEGNVPNLWLTYAWKDNENQDVDFVVQRLESQGISVRLDRTQLLAGKRLWEQISSGIENPQLDGWAIFATENSLRSEPCLEEIAYALDRAIRKRGNSFPLIGIFPTPIDRSIIPSALATRLYVNLKDKDWHTKIRDSLNGVSTQRTAVVDPYEFLKHRDGEDWVYEMRPRDGVWHPAIVVVLEDDYPSCSFPHVTTSRRPSYRPPMWKHADIPTIAANDGSRWRGWSVEDQVDSTKSLYLRSKKALQRIGFGSGSPSAGGIQILDIR